MTRSTPFSVEPVTETHRDCLSPERAVLKLENYMTLLKDCEITHNREDKNKIIFSAECQQPVGALIAKGEVLHDDESMKVTLNTVLASNGFELKIDYLWDSRRLGDCPVANAPEISSPKP